MAASVTNEESHGSAVAVLEPLACSRQTASASLRAKTTSWDKCPLFLAVLFSAYCIPLIDRSTANPHYLAAFINDEPAITQQLVSMSLPPYGNPARYFRKPELVPAEWQEIKYPNYIYYGGGYLGAGFLIYAPLKMLGCEDFPMAPIVLRTISYLFGLFSLLVLYYLAKRLGGSLAGLAASLLLFTDVVFYYYSTIIHPDVMMLALALVALWIGDIHARCGSTRSLVALGVLAGLVHGTKMGGPWMIPMASLAVYWGFGQLGPVSLRSRESRNGLLRRFALLGGCAALAFFISTPYALLDSYYYKMVTRSSGFFTSSPWSEANPAKWLAGLTDYFGWMLSLLACLGLSAMVFRGIGRNWSPALLLPVVLCLSVFTWYSTIIRLWVCVHYLLPALAVCYLAIGVLIGVTFNALRRQGIWAKMLQIPAVICLFAALVHYRGVNCGIYMFAEMLRDYTTGFQIGEWAKENLPAGSKIIYDDGIYIDRRVFPAYLQNNLLTYDALEKMQPDYFILSGSLYHAPHYVELRKTQKFTRGNEGYFSVLLYQDLLDREGHPDIQHVKTLLPTPFSGSTYSYLWTLVRCVFADDVNVRGHEIRLYRYQPRSNSGT